MAKRSSSFWTAVIFAATACFSQHVGKTEAILYDRSVSPNNFPWTPMTHGHSSAVTPLGTMVCVWFGGMGEGFNDVNIWIARKEAGKGWDTPIIVDYGGSTGDDPMNLGSTQDPVIYQPSAVDSPLIVYLGALGNTRFMRLSYDDGKTWSERKSFHNAGGIQYRGPQRSVPLEIKGGSTFPHGTALMAGDNKDFSGCFIDIAPPGNLYGDNPSGGAWQRIRPSSFNGKIHATFLVHDPQYQKLEFITRIDFGEGPAAFSNDGGLSWGSFSNMSGEFGNRGLHAASLDILGGDLQGWHVFVGENLGGGRNVTAISISQNGTNWDNVLTLKEGGKYPSVIQAPDRMVHICSEGPSAPHHTFHDRSVAIDFYESTRQYIIDPAILTGEKQPSGPPVITMHPVTQGVYPEWQARFEAIATGAQPLAYQWQISTDNGASWNDVSSGAGADTWRYDIEQVTLSDNGKQYRLKASNSSGTAYSDPALLKVKDLPVYDDLICHLPLDEGSGNEAGDVSGNGYNGEIRSGTWVADGKIGGALSFDGTRTSIDLGVDEYFKFTIIPDDPDYWVTSQFTLAGWFYVEEWGTLISKNIRSFRELSYQLGKYTSGGNDALGFQAFAWRGVRPKVLIPYPSMNEWHHIAASYDGTWLKTWVDGVAVDSSYEPGYYISPWVQPRTMNLRIGAASHGGGTVEFFKGMADDIRIYGRALSAEDMQNLYNGNPVEPAHKRNPGPGTIISGVTISSLDIRGNFAVRYALQSPARVQVEFYDSRGSLAGILADCSRGKGLHAHSFTRADIKRMGISSGMYLVTFSLDGTVLNAKKLVMR
ncbi:MAG: hypothetical protein GF350_00995 [Chitinivibrionales bacterium]|nr:hypothetical protein [Chitinivibrionales bacterium]